MDELPPNELKNEEVAPVKQGVGEPTRLLTIYEAAAESGISEHTLRYYDKCGFFKGLERTGHGNRRFSAQDLERLKLIDSLRKSGLSIEGIQFYLSILESKHGNKATALSILEQQCATFAIKIEEDKKSLEFLQETLDAFQQRYAPNQE